MKNFCIILLLLLIGIFNIHSQTTRIETKVGFYVNQIHIDSKFKDNKQQLAVLDSILDELSQDSTIEVVSVLFRGAASPEGNDNWNRYLAKNRRLALEKIIRNKINLDDSNITYNDSYIPWDDYREQIDKSNLPYRDTVLSIIDEGPHIVNYHPYKNKFIDHRILKLQKLYKGKAWREMLNLYFADLRYSYITISYRKIGILLDPLPLLCSGVTVEQPRPTEMSPIEQIKCDSTDWTPELHLKTNAVGWGLLIANAAVEVDVAQHWSLNLPIYYSAWNYGISTIKFRTFSIYPEVRYWFSKDNEGLFLDAHLGLAYYNYAFNGDIRYQDHLMKTPAIGGGIGVGYRLPISKNKRWKLEFAIGAGAYSINYDQFYNTPNTMDGLLINSVKKVFFGIDQADITFSYAFDIKRKKGGAK